MASLLTRTFIFLCCILWTTQICGQVINFDSIGPTGWLVQKEPKDTLYIEPNKNGMILLSRMPDNPEIDFRDSLPNMLEIDAFKKCPDTEYIRSTPILNDTGRQLTVATETFTCSAIGVRYKGEIFLLLTMGKNDVDVPAKAIATAARMMGMNSDGSTRAQFADLPNIPLVKKASIYSSGSKGVWHGIWVASVSSYVYDPIMTTRLEYGTRFLVLHKSGYFMTSMPRDTGLDQASIEAEMIKDPDNAGTYRIQGRDLLLSFASGTTMVAERQENGFRLGNDDYNAKQHFADGTALSGDYSSSRITQSAAGVYILGEDDFSFSVDGRFAKGGSVSLSSDLVSTNGGYDRRTGRYSVKNSALYLAYDDGSKEIASMWQESEDGPIWFNNNMHKVTGVD